MSKSFNPELLSLDQALNQAYFLRILTSKFIKQGDRKTPTHQEYETAFQMNKKTDRLLTTMLNSLK